MTGPDGRIIAVSELDEAELGIRILEASLRQERPEGMSGRQALNALDDDSRERCIAGARAALEYFQERIGALQPVN